MPNRRFSLSRAERGRYRSDAQHLCALGLDVEVRKRFPEDLRALDITLVHLQREYASTNSQKGIAYYAIWVRIVAMRPRVILDGLRDRRAIGTTKMLLLTLTRKPLFLLGEDSCI